MKRESKRSSWERIGKELENDLLGTRKLIYNTAKNYRKCSQPPTYAIKNQNGVDLLTEQKQIRLILKEYFIQHLKVTNDNDDDDESVEDINDSDEEPLSREELRNALSK